MLALLVEGHRDTHFGTDSLQLVARSRRGSRPGSSLADAIFNAAFCRPLKVVDQALRRLGASLKLRPLGIEPVLSRQVEADDL
eukprot:3176325-Pyramimonas_sp.AAC.1